MTEAVAETWVGVGAEVAVEIFFAGGGEFVDATRVFEPGEVEMFEEGGGAAVEHGAPEVADEGEGGFDFAGAGESVEDVVSVKWRHVVGAAGGEEFARGGGGVALAGEDLEGGGGLGAVGVGDDGAGAGGGGGAEIGDGGVVEREREARAGVESEDEKSLEAGVNGGLVFRGGPVEETPAVELLVSVGANGGGEFLEEGAEVVVLFGEVGEVAVVEPVLFVDEDPPHGVGADAVHPLVARGAVADEIEAARDDVVVAEDGVDGGGLGVHVADPDEAVAFDAVPEVFLHVEVDGGGAGLPDAVEAFVAGAEGAELGDVADHEDGADLGERDGLRGVEGVDADEAEAGGAEAGFAEPGERGAKIAERVIVGGVAVAEFGHGFGGGFAEADADGRRCFRIRERGEEFDVAVEFAAEVEEEAGGRIRRGGGEDGGRLEFLEVGLAGAGGEEAVGVSDAGGRLPEDARDGEIEFGERGAFGGWKRGGEGAANVEKKKGLEEANGSHGAGEQLGGRARRGQMRFGGTRSKGRREEVFVNLGGGAASLGAIMKNILVSLALVMGVATTAQAQHYRPSVVRDSTIVGAVAGALIGGHNGDRWAEGAIIGAAAGAVVGAVVDNNRSERVEYRHHHHVSPAPVVVVNPAPVVVVNRAPRRVVYVDSCPPPVVVSRPVVVINRHRHGHHHHHSRYHRH
jgi:hypothetical protein